MGCSSSKGAVSAAPATRQQDHVAQKVASDQTFANGEPQPASDKEITVAVAPGSVAGFAWPEFVGPSSRVIKTPQDWRDEGILIPHEAFRWLHNQIRAVLAQYDPFVAGQEWKTPVLFKWLSRYYIQAVHHHHDAEEHLYNPAIIAKGGELPDKISADHKEIMQSLDACAAFQSRIEAGSEQALQEFKAHVTHLLDMIEEHLAEEEEAYPAALRMSSMTQEEEKAVVLKIIQQLGLGGNKVLLPVIVYAVHIWAGKEKAEMFVKALPAPVRLLFRRSWLKDFQTNNLAVIAALQGTEPLERKHASGCLACVR